MLIDTDNASLRLNDLRRSLATKRRWLPGDHLLIGTTLRKIAAACWEMGLMEEGAGALAELREIERRSQTNCAGPGCARKLREDGAPLDV